MLFIQNKIFRTKQNIQAWGSFLFSQFLAMELIVFNKEFLYSIEGIDSLKTKLKGYIISNHFFKVLGV